MGSLKQKFSLIVAILVIALFSFHFFQKIEKVTANQETCVCAYDGFGYYMYLPSLVNNGTLDMQQSWAKELQDNYCSKDIPVYQLQPVPDNKYVDIYHMGLAFLQLPSYMIAEKFAVALNYKRDGFSKPYHIAYLLNALFFIVLGVVYLRKLLRLFFDELISGTIIIILYACSNIYPTFIDAYQLTHLYVFALNALFLYHLFKFMSNEQKKSLVFSSLFFGISCFVRPTQAIWGIIPLLLFWKKFGFNRSMIFLVAFFPIAAIIFNIPHLIYWKTIGGQWLMMNLHTEEIVLTDPNFWKFLFSYRKGWLLYTPIFLLLIPGFMAIYRSKKELFWPFLLLVFINIYILCSWECWWYAASYSSRVMIDSYPLLCIIIGFALLSIKKRKILAFSYATFILLCLTLNSVQIIQYTNYYLHVERMSKEHYWYIFGKTSIAEYSDYRLEIDRANVEWINNPNYQKDKHFSIAKKTVFKLKNKMTLLTNIGTTIGKIQLSDFLSTDETMFDISLRCKTADSTQSIQFKFEQTGRHNTYSWTNIELSKGLRQNKWNEIHLRVNETHLRHAKDFIQIYAVNEGNTRIEIDSLKIVAYSLIRK